MLKVSYFHANALDKLPKTFDQFNSLLSTLDEDAVVSINTTELSTQGSRDIYSYTICIVYKTKG